MDGLNITATISARTDGKYNLYIGWNTRVYDINTLEDAIDYARGMARDFSIAKVKLPDGSIIKVR